MTPKVVVLQLHRKWFALVIEKNARKRKRIEYRRWTPFWERRIPREAPFVVRFLNGMRPPIPEADIKAVRVEWDRTKGQIRIHLGRILRVKNWPPRA